MCAAHSDVCLTDVIYDKCSFEHASMNIYPGIRTLRCQKNCFRLYPSIKTSQLMKKTGCICNDKYKLREKSMASSIRGFKCVFICKVNLAILQGEIAVGADVMWEVEGPDDPTAVCHTQPGKTSAGEEALEALVAFTVRSPLLEDPIQPPVYEHQCRNTADWGFSRSREGVVFQTVVIKLWMRVTNLSLSDESGLPEVSRSLVSASSHRTDGCWKTEP